ncbi:hypothetical protein D3C87_1733800 [compost metagenome]
MPGSISSGRIDVKPTRKTLPGALAPFMKKTSPGSTTTPSASAASDNSAAFSHGGPCSQQDDEPVMGVGVKSGRWRASAWVSSAPRFW